MFEKNPPWLFRGWLITFIVVNGYFLFPIFCYLQSTVVLVITAALLAFLLNYPVSLLMSWKFKRGYAVAVVFLIALVILVSIVLTLLPILLNQLNELTHRLPSWIDSGSQQLQTFETWAIDNNLPFDVSALEIQLEERFATEVKALPTYAVDLIVEAFGSSLELLVTLILTLYLLLNGQSFWGGIWQWLPKDWSDLIKFSLNKSFQNYFIGQSIIATIMSLTITTAFLILKVPFGLLFGIAIGALVLVPFGDIVGIIGVSLLMALKSFWLGGEVLVVATIIDQAVDNAIAPRIFGGLVGLNPVWIIISLLLGAKLGGVLGVIIAVPLAATVKITAQSWQAKQLNSEVANNS
jgi:predicted PurR-regulated permease PerM